MSIPKNTPVPRCPLPLLISIFLLALVPGLRAQALEERLEGAMQRNGAVGLAVVVVKDNAIIYTKSLGWKDLEGQVPLEPGDIFRIASISKSFSATAIMQLVEQGKLSLEDEVGDLIGFPIRNPKFPDVPITLKMLLSHTSSLTDNAGYFTLDVINPERNPNWGKSYADRAPGSKYEYCNLAFNTIGAIIERVTGQRFDGYIKEHILDPLGLYGGYYVDQLDTTRIAQIYSIDEQRGRFERSGAYRPLGNRIANYTLGYSAPLFSPTGGMKISAQDLAKYMMMHMNYGQLGDVRIIQEAHAREMQRPLVWMDAKRDYGYALHHDRGHMVPGVELIGHTGDAYGLNSVMMFDPLKKFGMVVITNGFSPSDPPFQSQIMGLLYDHFIATAPKGGPKAKKAPVDKFSLSLGGQGKGNPLGSFVDMKKREVLDLESAFQRQGEVDLLYAYGETTGANLMVPGSWDLQYFGDPGLESVFYTWKDKTYGSLLRWEGSPVHSERFQQVKNNRQLREAYEEALGEVGQREGHKRWEQGPNARVQGLKKGDIVFLRIPSRKQGILALLDSPAEEILAMGQIVDLAAGKNGQVEIDFKSFVTD